MSQVASAGLKWSATRCRVKTCGTMPDKETGQPIYWAQVQPERGDCFKLAASAELVKQLKDAGDREIDIVGTFDVDARKERTRFFVEKITPVGATAAR